MVSGTQISYTHGVANALLLIAATALLAGQDSRHPNIVVILADDLGAVDLGCYSADLIETPRLDGLAKEGIVFRQAYASAPVCSPRKRACFSSENPCGTFSVVHSRYFDPAVAESVERITTWPLNGSR